MNIELIKSVVNDDLLLESQKRSRIIQIIAEDKQAIPDLLSILNEERNVNRTLITDMNSELSRAAVVLKDISKPVAEPKWIVEQIKLFYAKWERSIKCNFEYETTKNRYRL